MKIVVTGCNGSVGRRVALHALKEGHQVLGVDWIDRQTHTDVAEANKDPNFSFVEADLRDYDTTMRVLTGCDAIVHLAAYPNPGDYIWQTHNSNVVMSWNVLRSAAELKITRVVQASSVNVVQLVYSVGQRFHYFPIDEDHPCEPDEPYGLSKVIAEMQADTIVRRYPSMRIASLRLQWSLPNIEAGIRPDPAARSTDLWGWLHQDSAADAFLLALTTPADKWKGHETFFIAAPTIAIADAAQSAELHQQFYPHIPLKEGKTLEGRTSFFDCSKANRLLGWTHNVPTDPSE